MAGTHFKGPLLHGPDSNTRKYGYRVGTGMMPSAEFDTQHFDFTAGAASNLPNDAPGTTAVIDVGATLTENTALGEKSGVVGITSDGTLEGVSVFWPKTILLEAGKKFFMEVRVYSDDADDTDVKFGLSDVTAQVNPEDIWDTTTTDFIAVGVTDGSANLTAVYDKNNGGPVTDTFTNRSGDTLTLADATWTTLAFGFDGALLTFYKDGIHAGYASTAAQVPNDLLLAPYFSARTGGDAAHNVYFDYVRWSQER